MNIPKTLIIKYTILFFLLIVVNVSYCQTYKSDTLKIKSLIDKGDNIYYYYIDSSYVYYQKALQLSKQIGSKKFEALSLLNIGYYLDEKERYTESLEFYLQAIESYKSINDESGVAQCYNYIGYSFAYINSLENSMKYYFKALKIYTKLNDSIGISDIYNGIGNVHYDQENYSKAHEYYLKSYEIYKSLNDKEGINASYINIGNAISDQGRLDEGLEYYFKSIQLSKELDDKEGLAINYVNIGDCYIAKGDYDSASDYLNKSLLISNEIGYKSLYPYIYSTIAHNKLKQKKYAEVVINADKSLEYAKKATWVDLSGIDNHEYLSMAYEKLGNYKKAYENHKLFKTYKDSIFNVKKVEQVSKLNALYELEDKEKTIASLTENEYIRKIELKNHKTMSFILVGFSIFFIFLIFLLNKKRKEINKANILLSIEKERVEESDRLKSSFLANMSHEIRTPMNAVLGFTSFLKDPELSDEKRDRFVDVIQKSGERLMTIINDIIDISKIESNQLKIDIEDINVAKTLQELVEIQKETNNLLSTKNIDLKLNLPSTTKDIFIKTDENRFIQIFNNLISNASKFTEKGFIEVGYNLKQHPENSFLEFYVKDTGCGIPKNKFEMIFDRFSQAGDKDFKIGNGLGLSISKGLMLKLGGKIWVESEESVGTTFYFTLPY